jgi:hypothetical protein
MKIQSPAPLEVRIGKNGDSSAVVIQPGCRADPPQRVRPAILLLLQAHDYAEQLRRDAWDFAVEIQTFKEQGLTCNELRWMLFRGLVKHGVEITKGVDNQRRFRGSTGPALHRRSCFVLSPAGLKFARLTESCATDGELRVQPARILSRASSRAKRDSSPHWDATRLELRVGTRLVKAFRVPSPNQAAVLAAFEEEGWPAHIDDPLPYDPDVDPKQRLHDTIKSLNRNQKIRLIRFLGDGRGVGIRWEPLVAAFHPAADGALDCRISRD